VRLLEAGDATRGPGRQSLLDLTHLLELSAHPGGYGCCWGAIDVEPVTPGAVTDNGQRALDALEG
jgi:hypothetical protein